MGRILTLVLDTPERIVLLTILRLTGHQQPSAYDGGSEGPIYGRMLLPMLLP